MKKLLLAILLLNVMTAMAQPDVAPELSHYLFPDFTKGKVFFKGGGVNSPMLNYNALTNEMVFQNNDGSILAIANPEDVDSVVIEGRQFNYVDKKFYEKLTTTPHPLYREYICTIEQPGVSTGYGTTTNTSSATYLRGIYGPNAIYRVKLPEGVKVTAKQIWWVKTDKGFEKFISEQQLKKIFPDKKDQISEYAKKNNVRFSKQEDVKALVQAIDQ